MNKQIIYIDQDDVLADFYKAANCANSQRIKEELMWEPDFFLNLEPTPKAQYAVRILESLGYDLWVLTQPLAGHPECYSDKARWIQKYFPQLYNKVIMTQDKGLLLGEYLIDDNATKWKTKFEKNGGTFIHFPYGGCNRAFLKKPDIIWTEILDYFTNIATM